MKRLLASTAVLLLLCFCGSSSSGGGTPPPVEDAGTGSGLTLSVNNFDNWCVVNVNGSPNLGQYTFDAGTIVNLAATAAAGFEWGYWTSTDGANAGNGGHDPNMDTTVTMTSDKSVLACCPSATLKCPN
jgi:hypothetical protein